MSKVYKIEKRKICSLIGQVCDSLDACVFCDWYQKYKKSGLKIEEFVKENRF